MNHEIPDYTDALDTLETRGITYEMIPFDNTNTSPHFSLQFYMKVANFKIKANPLNSNNVLQTNLTSTYEHLPNNLINYSEARFVIDTTEIDCLYEYCDDLTDRCNELEDECDALMTHQEYSSDYSDRYNDFKSQL